MTTPLTIPLSPDLPSGVESLSGVLLLPPDARALYVLAHGAGAGMRHAFLESMAHALAERRIGTLRYQFPYMEAGRKRTDVPAVAEAAVAAAVRAAGNSAPGMVLLAGGKSFGGRMTSGAAAKGMLGAVRGIVFLGFPLHAPGRPGTERAEHLERVSQPMLFLQGTKDEFAKIELLRSVIDRLGSRVTLRLIEGGDHSFRTRNQASAAVTQELAGSVEQWARELIG